MKDTYEPIFQTSCIVYLYFCICLSVWEVKYLSFDGNLNGELTGWRNSRKMHLSKVSSHFESWLLGMGIISPKMLYSTSINKNVPYEANILMTILEFKTLWLSTACSIFYKCR